MKKPNSPSRHYPSRELVLLKDNAPFFRRDSCKSFWEKEDKWRIHLGSSWQSGTNQNPDGWDFPASQATCGGQLLSKGTPTLKMDVDSLPKEELNTQGLITRHQRFMVLILPRWFPVCGEHWAQPLRTARELDALFIRILMEDRIFIAWEGGSGTNISQKINVCGQLK